MRGLTATASLAPFESLPIIHAPPGGFAGNLTPVHVLDAQPLTERAPVAVILDRIRMQITGHSGGSESRRDEADVVLQLRRISAGSMDCHVGEFSQIQ